MRNTRESVTVGIGPLDCECQTDPSQAIDASAQGRKAEVPMREDRTHKNLFKHPRMLRSLLEWFVREDWVGLIEWDDPQPSLIHTEHVTDRLAVRQNDVVWQLGWKGPEARYVYLMLEFQSGVDRTMSLRMQSYSALAQEELVCKLKLPTPLGVVARWCCTRGAPAGRRGCRLRTRPLRCRASAAGGRHSSTCWSTSTGAFRKRLRDGTK